MEKNRALLLVILVITTPKIVNGQSPLANGARHAALAYATPALRDEWMLWNNPAGLSALHQLAVSGFAEHNKNLPGADRKAIAVTCPLWRGGFGVGVNMFGNELYKEQVASLAFGHQLGIAALGLRIDVIQYNTDGNRYTLMGIAFGGIADIHEKFSIGAWASNINQPALPGGQLLPIKMIAGPMFKPAENVIVAMAIEKDMTYDVSYRAGMEYRIHKKFFARTGFRIFPSSAHFGIGFLSTRLKIDYAIQFNPSNNHSHQVSLSTVIWNRKQTKP